MAPFRDIALYSAANVLLLKSVKSQQAFGENYHRSMVCPFMLNERVMILERI